MKNKGKLKFYDCIGEQYRPYFEHSGVPSLSSTTVKQLQSKNKFLYSLDKEHYFNQVQRNLVENVFSKIKINSAAVAFREKKSYLNFLEPHLKSYYFIRLDLKSFFHSIPLKTLKENFEGLFVEKYTDKGENQETIDGLINLITYKVPSSSNNEKFRNKTIVPMGFRTSPVISNIIFRKIDLLIQEFCFSKGVFYSRYADDMLFSSTKDSKFVLSDSFTKEIKFLLSINKFNLNNSKTLKSLHTMSLNGYVVESKDILGREGYIRVSNKKTKVIDKLIFKMNHKHLPKNILEKLFGMRESNLNFPFSPPTPEFLDKYYRDQLVNKMTGYRSYLIGLIHFNDQHKCMNIEAINKYSYMIDSLNIHIDKLVR
jgi:hypothetical protein